MVTLPPNTQIHVVCNTTQDVWEIKLLLEILQCKIEARDKWKDKSCHTPGTKNDRFRHLIILENQRVYRQLYLLICLKPFLPDHNHSCWHVFTALKNIFQLRVWKLNHQKIKRSSFKVITNVSFASNWTWTAQRTVLVQRNAKTVVESIINQFVQK